MLRVILIVILGMAAASCGPDAAPTPSPATSPASMTRAPATRAAVDGEIIKVLATLLKLREAEIKPTARLADLKMDDLDFVEAIMELEDTYKVSIPDERLNIRGMTTESMLQMTVHELGDIVRDCIAHPVARHPTATSPLH